MELLFDFLMVFLLEGSAEFFLHVYEMFVPDKEFSAKHRWALAIVGMVASLGLFAGFLIGLVDVLQNRGNSVWGWIGIVLGVAYLSAGIALKSAAKLKKK